MPGNIPLFWRALLIFMTNGTYLKPSRTITQKNELVNTFRGTGELLRTDTSVNRKVLIAFFSHVFNLAIRDPTFTRSVGEQSLSGNQGNLGSFSESITRGNTGK